MDKFIRKYPSGLEAGWGIEMGWGATRLLLHVDDDPDVVLLLERALRVSQMGHWRLQYRPAGSEALEYLQQSINGEVPMPDLLVLDLKMPGLSGLEVLEWVNANIPALPAVILSSSGLLEDRLRARDLGSKGYFEKSAMFSEFMEFLRGWETFQFCVPERKFPESGDWYQGIAQSKRFRFCELN